MQLATYWTFSDDYIQTLNIYASNNQENYNRFNDKFFLELRDQLIDRIQELKCYDC